MNTSSGGAVAPRAAPVLRAALVALALLMIFAAWAAVGPADAGAAGAAVESDLDPEQQGLAENMEHRFIAPCCWTQTVAVHESQASEQVKQQIRLLVAQGADEKEITDNLVSQYGEEILAAPRASGFNLLAYALPVLALVLGGGLILLLVGRWRASSPAPQPVAPQPVKVSDRPVRPGRGDTRSSAEENELRARMERELSDFDQ